MTNNTTPETTHLPFFKEKLAASGGIRTHDFCFPGKCSTTELPRQLSWQGLNHTTQSNRSSKAIHNLSSLYIHIIILIIYTYNYTKIKNNKNNISTTQNTWCLAPSTLAGLHVMGVVPPCSRVDHRSEY